MTKFQIFPALVKACIQVATSYKLIKVVQCFTNWKIPRHSTATEAVVIDNDLHIKLFFSSSPIPFPPWFVKGKDYRLTKRLIWKTFRHT